MSAAQTILPMIVMIMVNVKTMRVPTLAFAELDLLVMATDAKVQYFLYKKNNSSLNILLWR